MITIDQLLESVDLDFEPRWVTKDESGDITIYSHRPTPEGWCNEWREGEGDYKIFGELKLSEFENKYWTECIYEVPRKTTGKIKKLPFLIPEDGAKLDVEFCLNIMNGIVIHINELVEAVNELKGSEE